MSKAPVAKVEFILYVGRGDEHPLTDKEKAFLASHFQQAMAADAPLNRLLDRVAKEAIVAGMRTRRGKAGTYRMAVGKAFSDNI